MKLVILLVNVLALGVGASAIVLAFRLVRETHDPAARDYLVFTVLMVVSGFFDWIVFSLVRALVPDVTAGQLDAIFHLFWNVVGFPCVWGATAWLLLALLELVNLRPSRRQRRLVTAPFLAVGGLSVLGALLSTLQIRNGLGPWLWSAWTHGLPVVHLVWLTTALWLTGRLPTPARAPVRRFLLALLVGLSGWHVLSLVPSPLHPSNDVSIIWFYGALLVPAVLLGRPVRLVQRRETLADYTLDTLAPVFERAPFTERERDVLVLLLKGKSYKVMQDDLHVSLQTVKNYVSRIYGKLEVANRVELVNLVRNLTERRP